MKSLCINQLDNTDNIAPCRLNDYSDGKLIDKTYPETIFLNYDNKTTLEEGMVAIWEWGNGTGAKESESSKNLCEIIRETTMKNENEKTIVHNLRKKLKKGIKLKHIIDPRWNLFIIYNSKDNKGVLLESDTYTCENGVVKIIETDDALQCCPIYIIPNECSIKSNGALILGKRREFIMNTELVLTDSLFAVKEADEIALYFIGKYKNLITKYSRKSKDYTKMIDQLLHSEPLKSHYPRELDVEQLFNDEEVSKTLESRLIGDDSEINLIDSFLKSNQAFTKSCENRVREEIKNKYKLKINGYESKLKKLKNELKNTEKDKNTLTDDIKNLVSKKTEIQLAIDSLCSTYNSKKEDYKNEFESYQQKISNDKASLDIQIDTLNAEISTLEASKRALDDEKQAFLKTFGTSSLNESILPALIEKIAKHNNQQIKAIIDELKKLKLSSESSVPVVIPPTETIQQKYLIIRTEKLPSSNECNTSNLEDSLENNLKDCGMSLKSASELASYLQAAILSKRSIIVCGDKSECISNSISSSIIGNKCTHILYTGNNPIEILNIVNEIEEMIVSIDGILNTLDYNAYFTLTKYSKKILIFSCNDLKMLQAAPIDVWSSSILVDLTHDFPINGTPAHPTILNTYTADTPKSDCSDVIKSVLCDNAIKHNSIITGTYDFLHRLIEYDSRLSTTYLKHFLKFLSKVSELNSDE